MIQFSSELKKEIDQALIDINKREVDVLKKSKEVTLLLENAFDRLRTFTLEYKFQNDDEEILFFKDIKPNLFANLIYHSKVYNLEINRPTGGDTEIKNYLERELCRIKDFFDRNNTFYRYYRSGETEKDSIFFLRGNSDNSIHQESFSFERDPKFSTCCDYKMAKVLANEKVESYILEQLNIMGYLSERTEKRFPKAKLTWTISKIFLIELIYAIHLFGAFNYGKATLKEIISYFEEIFNVDLGANPSKSYIEMRERKQRITFLDRLREALSNKMDEDDEKELMPMKR